MDGNIGAETGWMGFGIPTTDTIGATITIAGYTTIPSVPGRKLYSRSGNLHGVYERKIDYFISTNAGQSGGPVFGVNNISYGIHTYGFSSQSSPNSATRINECIFSLMRDSKMMGKVLYE